MTPPCQSFQMLLLVCKLGLSCERRSFSRYFEVSSFKDQLDVLLSKYKSRLFLFTSSSASVGMLSNFQSGGGGHIVTGGKVAGKVLSQVNPHFSFGANFILVGV